jgi:neurofibromin 1
MSELLAEGYIEEQNAQRKAVESASSISMVCNILNFLDASPMTLFEGPPNDRSERDRFYEENLEALISCIIAADDSVRRLATGVAKRLFAKEQVLLTLRSSKGLSSKAFKSKFWRLTSLILISIYDRARLPCTAEGLKSINAYLESRLLLLTSIPELGHTADDIFERTAASTKLEALFLVSLCSADIDACQIVTSCIGTFLDECRLIDTAPATAKSSLTLLRNGDIFGEISARDFRFTGLVAFQKRIRALLRRMQYPSAGILDAWELVFDRWLHLSKDISQAATDNVTERMVAEWRNYSGFLASLGGICTAEQASNLEEPAISGLRWIDRLSSGVHEEPLLTRYLRLSIQLLACANVRVRETMREVLSTEIPPSLFQPLFKALETELDVLFTGALEPSIKGQDNDIIFAEQSSSLLKALVERLDTPSDLGAASSLHLGALCLNFAKFLDGVPDTPSSLRVKIKVCQLVEAVTKRKEQLNLRDDVRNRNQLLEYVFSWIARPRSPRSDANTPYAAGRQDEMTRVQRDLDKACLRSLAKLTLRLPLQPGDGQTDAGTSELKSQMFHQYFNRFLSLLNMDPSGANLGRLGEHQHHHGGHFASAGSGGGAASAGSGAEASTADLAITILSNLLSANIDVGLKHSLSIGYHENVDIRTAFVRVLYNILVQGTEFNNLSDAAVNEKYDELLEVGCPPTDWGWRFGRGCAFANLLVVCLF